MSGGRGAQALQLGGLAAAVVLAGLVNVLAARHFTRWDWTHDRRWSPSPATLETLHGLEQQVDVWVIAGDGEPVEQSLRPLLAAYRAETSRLEVHWIDPDRDAVQLLDLQRRFGLEAGRTAGRAHRDRRRGHRRQPRQATGFSRRRTCSSSPTRCTCARARSGR